MKWPLFNLITSALVRSLISRENEWNWKNEMAESLKDVRQGGSATSFIYTTWGKVQSVQSWGARRTLPVSISCNGPVGWTLMWERAETWICRGVRKKKKKVETTFSCLRWTLFLIRRWWFLFHWQRALCYSFKSDIMSNLLQSSVLCCCDVLKNEKESTLCSFVRSIFVKKIK